MHLQCSLLKRKRSVEVDTINLGIMDTEIRNINVFNQDVMNMVDDKVSGMMVMGSPLILVAIIALYLAVVLKLGPDYMKKRQPYKLKYSLLIYNFVQVAFSMFIAYQGTQLFYEHGVLRKKCIIKTEMDEAARFITMFYYYLMAKLVELLDTVFFVLRKKQSQVTFLHVYHHTFIVAMCWLEMKYERNENFAFIATINSFVHVIMYSYYGLSAAPALRKYLWWKKYLTSMQLIQFIIALCHLVVTQFVSDCPLSVLSGIVTFGNLILFAYLFYSFYTNNYVKSKKVDNEIKHDRFSNGKDKRNHSNGIPNSETNDDFQNGNSNGIKNDNPNNKVQNGNRNFETLNDVCSNGMSNGKYSNGLQNRKHSNGK